MIKSELHKLKNFLSRLGTAEARILIARWLLAYLALVVASITLQSITNPSFFIDELKYLGYPFNDLKSIAKAVVYLISYSLSIAFLLLALSVRSTVLALVFLVYFLLTHLLDVSTQVILNGSGFTTFQYVLFLNEGNNIKNLLIFLSEISKALVITAVFGGFLLLTRKFVRERISFLWVIMLAPFCFLTVVVAKAGVHYIKYESYSSPIKVPIIIAEYHRKEKDQPPRVLSPSIIPGPARSENIILIVDESISGNHLSINGYNRKTSPDLEELVKSGRITNFGVVNSVSNCSAFTNLMLRIGLSEQTKNATEDFIGTRIKLPTIFQFAKRAGYKTWLIDSQTDKNHLQGYLTYDDLGYVDEFFTHDTRTLDLSRDKIALEMVASIMDEQAGSKKFIVLVKDGAHWPYLWRIPDTHYFFEPVQSSEYEPMIRENKSKVVNTYDNLVRYTANDFLKQYIEITNLANSITFYTADHGQAFMEEGSIDNLTHCSSAYDPPSSQAAVPLLVIESRENRRYVPDLNSVYSQHQIFPTMLAEMGYSEEVIENYGRTLTQGYPKDTKRWFYWSMEGHRSPYLGN